MTTATKNLQEVVLTQWNDNGRKVAELAEAMPAGHFDFHPAAGVRSFADVLRHLVFWNRWVARSARGESPDGAANEIPASEAKGKVQLLAALARSHEEAARELAARKGELDAATAELYESFVAHTAEHYGQLVVYARLNGVVPPTSRG